MLPTRGGNASARSGPNRDGTRATFPRTPVGRLAPVALRASGYYPHSAAVAVVYPRTARASRRRLSRPVLKDPAPPVCRRLPLGLPGPSTAPAKLSRLMLTGSPAQPWSVMPTVRPRFLQTPACSRNLRSQVPRQAPVRNAAMRRARFLVPRPAPAGPRQSCRQRSCHQLCSEPCALAHSMRHTHRVNA